MRWLGVGLVVGLLVVADRPARGEQVHRLNVTTLVPPNRNGHLEVKKWKRDVERDSGGRLQLRLIPWRFLGTDGEIMARLRSGKLDAANVGTHAISTFVRQAKILSAPGLYRSRAHHARAHAALLGEFRREAYANGFELIGWSEVTPGRILASKPIRKPGDLAGLRAWRDPESTWQKHLHAITGALDSPIPLAGVTAALEANKLDVVYAGGAGAAMALGWHAHLKHISSEFGSAQLAFVMGRRRHDALPPELAKIFVERSAAFTARIIEELRREDDRVVAKMLTRGLRAFELDYAAWHGAANAVRQRLEGDQFTRELVERVRRM